MRGASGVSTDGAVWVVVGSELSFKQSWEREIILKSAYKAVAVAVTLFFLVAQGVSQTPRHVAVHAGHLLDF